MFLELIAAVGMRTNQLHSVYIGQLRIKKHFYLTRP